MPAKPRPNAGNGEQADFILGEHERRHGEDLANRTGQHRVEATHPIGDPAPELAAHEGGAQQHRQHCRAVRHQDAEIAAQRRQMCLRHRHRNTAEDARRAYQCEHEIGWPAHHGIGRGQAAERTEPQRQLRRRAQKHRRQRDDHHNLEQAIVEHGLTPAGVRDGALENRRPERTGDIGAARNQRERRAAAAVKPAADIDVERRVHAADAKKAYEQALANIKLPGLAAGRQGKPDANHHRPENDRRAHPSAFGDIAHDDAAGPEAGPSERGCQSRHRTQAAKFSGDRLERNNRDPRRTERHRQDHQHHCRNGPRRPGLDGGHGHSFMHSGIVPLLRAVARVIGGALDGLDVCLNDGAIRAWSARWCGARRQDAADREKHGHRRSSLRVLVDTNLPRSRSCREAAGMGAGL